jgi:anthranilate phosphoribosyltransferase
MTLPQLTNRAEEGHPLTLSEIQSACDLLLDEGQSTEVRAGFLEAFHKRGESPEEIAHFVEVLLERAVKLPFSGAGCIDVCGTGGDRAGFFNISTASMFVVAGAGAKVIKHGNRGITSKSGGADVLEALGVRVDLTPEATASALEDAGCCFLFAPACHPAFRAVVPVRKLLAARNSASIFNIIGPLLNPARPEFQLAGVYNPDLVKTYAGVFKNLGRTRAWAVHGTGPDGLRIDEVSPLGKTIVMALEKGSLSELEIHPQDIGIAAIAPEALLGGDAAENAKILLSIFDGSDRGPKRQAVQLNAAAALVVAGVASDLQTAWMLAETSLNEGRAKASLQAIQKASAL